MDRAATRGPGEFWLPALAVGAIVLAPYLTLTLPFRTALVTQAASILGIVAVVLARGVVAGGSIAAVLAAPRPLLAGVALYAAAALLGAVVALARGNDPTFLAGQLLSMGLLPLAAVAGLSLDRRRLHTAVAGGLVSAATVAVLIHFAHWAYSLGRGELVTRLLLPNNLAVVGISFLALLLAVGLLGAPRPRVRLFAWTAFALLSLYALGSGVRSLWLVAPPTVALLVLLDGGWRTRRRGRTLAAVAAVVLLVGLGTIATHRWWQAPRPNLLPAGSFPPPAPTLPPTAEVIRGPEVARGERIATIRWDAGARGRSLRLVLPHPVEASQAYRARVVLRGEGAGLCNVVFDWLDDRSQLVGRLRSEPVAPSAERTVALLGVPPPRAAAVQIRLACAAGGESRWSIRAVELQRLRPRLGALLAAQLEYDRNRLARLMGLEKDAGVRDDVSLTLRARELATLGESIRASSPAEMIFGRGLGATFPATLSLYDAAGHPATPEEVNYIHDFYLFLIYKLGLVGGAAVLVALGLWTAVPLSAIRGRPPAGERAFLATVAAAWIGNLVWSFAFPQFLDFRTAPLWGLLIAATAAAVEAAASRTRPVYPRVSDPPRPRP